MTLFDWIGQCKRTKYPAATKAAKEPLLDKDNSDLEEAPFEEEYSHDEIDEINSPSIEGKNKSILKFTSEHPLVQSHGLHVFLLIKLLYLTLLDVLFHAVIKVTKNIIIQQC